MNDSTGAARQVVEGALRELMAEFRSQGRHNRDTVAAVLTDRLGEQGPSARREVRLVAAAAGEGCPAELERGDAVDAVAARFAEATGFDREAAAWAVSAWARALGAEPVAPPDELDDTVREHAETRPYSAGGPTEGETRPSPGAPPTERTDPAIWEQGPGRLVGRRRELLAWYRAQVSDRPPDAAVTYTQSGLWLQVVGAAALAGLVIALVTGTPAVVPSGLVLVGAFAMTRRSAVVLTDQELTLVALTLTGRPKEVRASWPRSIVRVRRRGGTLFDRLSLVHAAGKGQTVYVPRREREHGLRIAARLPEAPVEHEPSTRPALAALFAGVLALQLGAGLALASGSDDEARSTLPIPPGTPGADDDSGPGGSNPTREPTSSTTPGDYYDTEHLSVAVPNGWSVEESSTEETITLSLPDGSANLIFTVGPVTDGITPEEYARSQVDIYPTEFPRYRQEVYEFATVFDGRDGLRLVYSWTPEDRGEPVYQEQHFWTSGAQGFVATLTTTTAADLDTHRDVMAELYAYPANE